MLLKNYLDLSSVKLLLIKTAVFIAFLLGVSYMIENLAILNLDTGECRELGIGKFTSQKTIEKRKEYFKKQEEFREVNFKYKEYGNFSWLIFTYCEELFPNMKLGHLTRLLYLSTYITYTGVLKICDKKYMTKSNMNNILKLPQKQFYDFYNEMINNKIIIENKKENCLNINSNYFFKGKVNNKYQGLIRLNHKSIRTLYENTPINKHKALAYVFKLIPYINREYNILCNNPLELDIDRIIVLNKTTDIARLCNYSEDKAKRLYEEISKITLNNQSVIKIYQDFNSKQIRIFANPKCYYAGTDYQNVQVLGAF